MNNSGLIKKLQKGQIDVIIMNQFSGISYINKLGLADQVMEQKFVHIEKNSSDTRVAFSKQNNLDRFREILDIELDSSSSKSKLNEYEQKYLKMKD